ncbi:hypothetical protein [Pseudonocardia sp. T1-2H]|uniref:hypothetical protein n=1 Tax=Pseudonocardia sp. T1-2H TaxID=3128899 RepID=UPI003100FEFF
MLYLKWTHCVLLPIRERFRSIDRTADTSPFRRMLGVLPGCGRRAVPAGRRAGGAPGRHRVPGRRGYFATTVLDVARAEVDSHHIDVQAGDLRGATFGIGRVTRRSPGKEAPS